MKNPTTPALLHPSPLPRNNLQNRLSLQTVPKPRNPDTPPALADESDSVCPRRFRLFLRGGLVWRPSLPAHLATVQCPHTWQQCRTECSGTAQRRAHWLRRRRSRHSEHSRRTPPLAAPSTGRAIAPLSLNVPETSSPVSFEPPELYKVHTARTQPVSQSQRSHRIARPIVVTLDVLTRLFRRRLFRIVQYSVFSCVLCVFHRLLCHVKCCTRVVF